MAAPAKLVCFEAYWNEKLSQTFSVKGFFEAMAPLAHPPLTVAHRFVESEAGLAYYAKRPGGLIWRSQVRPPRWRPTIVMVEVRVRLTMEGMSMLDGRNFTGIVLECGKTLGEKWVLAGEK